MTTQTTGQAVIRRPLIDEIMLDPWSVHVGFVVGAFAVGAASLGLFLFSLDITLPEVYKFSKNLETPKHYRLQKGDTTLLSPC